MRGGRRRGRAAGVDVADEPVERERVEEALTVGAGVCGVVGDEPGEAGHGVAFAVDLVDVHRRLTAGLVEVFLVDTLHGAVSAVDPVVSVDGDDEVVPDAQWVADGGCDAAVAGSGQAQVLVEGLAWHVAHGRLEYVRRGGATPGLPPFVAVRHEGCLGLGSCEAPCAAACGPLPDLVANELVDERCECLGREPVHAAGPFAERVSLGLGAGLHGAGAVEPDRCAEQIERTVGTGAVSGGPAPPDVLIGRQQPVEPT